MIYNDKLTFEITGEKLKKLEEFKAKHDDCLEKYPDVAGALLEYRFIPTGLGMVVTVQCSCGEELDLSDLDF